MIDAFINSTGDPNNGFFGRIIKPGKFTNINDRGIGWMFACYFGISLKRFIEKNETLNQIYTKLGVLNKDNNQGSINFWQENVANALIDFDFEDLCQITPNNDSYRQYFLLEKDLRAILAAKEIPEENYTINYGTIYGGRVSIIGCDVDDMFREELCSQKQKGLYLTRKPKSTNGTPQQ
ncbi:MAG: hypothetical protein K2J20_01950 [Bacilli bacterium]|nr:hypothetical protein [Bacilli bacterium]